MRFQRDTPVYTEASMTCPSESVRRSAMAPVASAVLRRSAVSSTGVLRWQDALRMLYDGLCDGVQRLEAGVVRR